MITDEEICRKLVYNLSNAARDPRRLKDAVGCALIMQGFTPTVDFTLCEDRGKILLNYNPRIISQEEIDSVLESYKVAAKFFVGLYKWHYPTAQPYDGFVLTLEVHPFTTTKSFQKADSDDEGEFICVEY